MSCLRIAVLLILLIGIISCGPKTSVDYRQAKVPSHHELVNRLAEQYREWHAVPYRSGGSSKNGIDCSAFVVLTYRDQFGMQVPRTTDELARIGRKVTADEARPGDLVLFKTGLFTKHVGIYFDQNRFLHASTSQGVTLSALDEPYWRKRLWQVRRVAF